MKVEIINSIAKEINRQNRIFRDQINFILESKDKLTGSKKSGIKGYKK